MKTLIVSSAVVLFLSSLAAPASQAQCTEYTQVFHLERCHFQTKADNLYFPLIPGTVSVYEGEEDGEEVLLQITVTCDTLWLSFTTPEGRTLWVNTRVVEEREWQDDELVEVSRNFFAQCRETGDVYYFGEEVDIYEDGEIVSHAGAWKAGVHGAQPGLIMPGTTLLGARFYQEVAPGVALDQAEITEACLDVQVPAGSFADCIRTRETTPLEPDAEEFKVYCPQVGLTIDGPVELVEQSRASCGNGKDEPEAVEERARMMRGRR